MNPDDVLVGFRPPPQPDWTEGLSGRARNALEQHFNSKEELLDFMRRHGGRWADYLLGFGTKTTLEIEGWLTDETLWTHGLSARATHLLEKRFTSKEELVAFIQQHGMDWPHLLPGSGSKTRIEIEDWLESYGYRYF